MKTYNDFADNADDFISEDLNKFLYKFRQYYRSGQKYSFREWIHAFDDLIHELD